MRRLIAVCALVLVTGCGTSDDQESGPIDDPAVSSESPEPVDRSGPAVAVRQLLEAIDDGECEAAQALVVTPEQLSCDLVEQSAGALAEEGNSLADATFDAGEVQGSSTTVTIDWGNGNPGETIDVERVGGQWLVVFDSAA